MLSSHSQVKAQLSQVKSALATWRVIFSYPCTELLTVIARFNKKKSRILSFLTKSLESTQRELYQCYALIVLLQAKEFAPTNYGQYCVVILFKC